jgi:hypothetical protein
MPSIRDSPALLTFILVAVCALTTQGVSRIVRPTAIAAQAAQPYPNCRLGVGSSESVAAYPVGMLNLGWYVNWQTALHPPHPNGTEYMQMVRLHRTGPDSYSFTPSMSELRQTALKNPGSVWLIGNEPDRRTWQDDIEPDLYAQAYHDLYTAVKAADPTARIAVGGIVQVTPLRLKYLEMMLHAYEQRFGRRLPADLWNIHTFILREEADSWGADLPRGINTAIGYQGTWTQTAEDGVTVHKSVTAGDKAVLSFEGDWVSWTALHSPAGGRVRVSVDHRMRQTVDTYARTTSAQTHSLDSLGPGRHALTLEVVGGGEVAVDQFHSDSPGSTAIQDDDPNPSMLYMLRDHDNLDLVKQQIVAFRRWMAHHGEGDKPLIISEYGVLFPTYIVDEAGRSFSTDRVSAFMTGSFDLFRTLRDPTLGYAADGDRLVQQWAWYSLADSYFNGALFNPITRQATRLGMDFQTYASQIPPRPDLLPSAISSSPALPYAPHGPITFTLRLEVANAGNVATPLATTVRVWDEDPQVGGVLISEVPVPSGLRGCGATTSLSLEWQGATAGLHHLHVQIDARDLLAESDKANNTAVYKFLVVNHLPIMLPLVLRRE